MATTTPPNIQKAPYLRVQRNFPMESQPLSVEMNKSYVDIANAVNTRTIGIFPVNDPIVTGETWYFSSKRQQSIRQLFTFTATGSIPHGISSFNQISPRSYGQFTDGTNYYGVIFGSSTAIAAQVSFYVTSTNIVVLSGSGAPSISSGFIDLEWIN